MAVFDLWRDWRNRLGIQLHRPVAVLVKWFPDRRGLITGIAVGGFGAGALVMAPVATRLIASVGVLPTFLYLGIAYLIVTVICGFFMQNPPAGWKSAGWNPSATQTAQRSGQDYGLGDAVRSWQWWVFGDCCFWIISRFIRTFGEVG